MLQLTELTCYRRDDVSVYYHYFKIYGTYSSNKVLLIQFDRQIAVCSNQTKIKDLMTMSITSGTITMFAFTVITVAIFTLSATITVFLAYKMKRDYRDTLVDT